MPVAIPAGTTYARFSLFDADVAPARDLDLCVFGHAPSGRAAAGRRRRRSTSLNPRGGHRLRVVVHGWGVPGSSPFKLHTWILGTAEAGNMTVTAPATAVDGATGTINLTFLGLTPGDEVPRLGRVRRRAGLPNPTIVRVERVATRDDRH